MNLNATKLEDLFKEQSDWCQRALVKFDDPIHRPAWHVTLGKMTEADHAVSFCLAGGAMQVCDGQTGAAFRLMDKLAERIRKTRMTEYDGMDNWTAVVEFNNSPSRTFEDIEKIIKGL